MFKVGDRVRLVKDYADNSELPAGTEGTVVEVEAGVLYPFYVTYDGREEEFPYPTLAEEIELA